ncbi:hypothetical protein [Sphingobacterium sp. ML3W]|uniref:hypothetical protein n=1 Tax=Sphingobacterium sp. ML3W TaxID=1538644 RepID=UPI000AEC0840|nr:hypothetical protein [Sphingobacterium sp. ML3W]
MATLTLAACAQESAITTSKTGIELVPYLTKNNTYTYVDKDLNPVINETFSYATPFTKTGFAIVGNLDQASAIIDSKGKTISPYTHSNIYMNEVSGYTLLISETSFDKKLPFWKWDWNIMSSDIKKTVPYKHLEVRVLETGQLLFDKKLADQDDDYNFIIHPIDDNHFVWNGDLYKIANKKFKIVKHHIEEVLDKGRYIPVSKNKFEIWESKTKQPILSNLTGKTAIAVTLNNKEVLLDSINQDRFAPVVPKILYDAKTCNTYIYPQYDKAFPKQIQINTKEHESFLKETSLIYSVNNSPYFILGKFNYDHDVWRYDWLYLDDEGNVHDQIPVMDFFITDQVGYNLWPDASMLIPLENIEKDWQLNKIKYVQESDDLFIILLKHETEKIEKKGLWNRNTQQWDIEPNNTDISILDMKRHLYAVQKEKAGDYIIYNNQTKQQVGQKAYASIYANGMVRKKNDAQKDQYFYIDLETGKEYKEQKDMNDFKNIHPTILQRGIVLAKKKAEDHYSDKFTYALPNWAMLTGNPEMIAAVQIYGNEGIQVTLQRVDFKVDFNNEASIQRYVNHLNKQMKTTLPLLGYVLFYKNVLIMQKDPNYGLALSAFEASEITRYNSDNTTPNISFITLTKDLEMVESTVELRKDA